ncbi:MAG: DUF177 domain-containing protein [Thermodesulfovibrionales bacterium]|nr:DUF177 domain-containing protein [Thermodesulfovibrionales bacterium]
MKIELAQIPEEGLEIKADEKVVIGDNQPVTAELDIIVQEVAGEFLVKGNVSASMELTCGRCLKEFKKDLALAIDLVYSRTNEAEGEGKDHEVTAGELNTGFITGDELDLAEVVSEQLMLSMPMRPLCEEGCKGICPKCGADLNEKECGCETRSIDPRFQVLKEYLKKKE